MCLRITATMTMMTAARASFPSMPRILREVAFMRGQYRPRARLQKTGKVTL